MMEDTMQTVAELYTVLYYYSQLLHLIHLSFVYMHLIYLSFSVLKHRKAGFSFNTVDMIYFSLEF